MTFEQIKKNIKYGDYNILQELLEAPSVSAVRMRFLRQDIEAVKAMLFIQENRDALIEKYKETQNQ